MSKYIHWKWVKNNEFMPKTKKKEKKVPNGTNNITDNKKSLTNDRLKKRELITNNGINPFISTQNYVDDLKKQDEFLRPQKKFNFQ